MIKGPLANLSSNETSVNLWSNAKEKKEADRDDNQASSSTNRVKFFRSKQKQKYSVAIQSPIQNQDDSDANHDSNDWISRKDEIVDCEVPIQSLTNDESLETDVQVRAFSVADIVSSLSFLLLLLRRDCFPFHFTWYQITV